MPQLTVEASIFLGIYNEASLEDFFKEFPKFHRGFLCLLPFSFPLVCFASATLRRATTQLISKHANEASRIAAVKRTRSLFEKQPVMTWAIGNCEVASDILISTSGSSKP